MRLVPRLKVDFVQYWQIPISAGQARPDRLAVISDNGRRTWRQLGANVSRVAGLVADRASAPGARVGVLLRNGAWQPELYFGISRAACILVPLNWRLAEADLGAVIEDAGIELIFASEDLLAPVQGSCAHVVVIESSTWEDVLAAASPPPNPSGQNETDVTMISYTSGQQALRRASCTLTGR